MRGTRADRTRAVSRAGIIPAYAGNTFSMSMSAVSDGDHPRVCGEHSTDPWSISEATGSSPRMRGTRINMVADCFAGGIIPAYAGNTCFASHASSIAKDHPRVCGEHRFHATGLLKPQGSSPRMRGTLEVHVGRPTVAGIIPAYAGNTHCMMPISAVLWDHPRVCGEHGARLD